MKIVNENEKFKKHIVAALVNNKMGVLARVSGLYTRRGFNIDSLAVGPTIDPKISRMTIVIDGDEYIAKQLTKQLSKLIDVLTVKRLTDEDDEERLTVRELILIKIKALEAERVEIIEALNDFKCEIVNVSHESLTIEYDAKPEKVEKLIDLLKKYEILEIARTGAIALKKGNEYLSK
jgi:acetolactate synthase-1/3 small subunit